MKVHIEITCNNEAFEPSAGLEVASILRKMASYAEQYGLVKGTCDRYPDYNGNFVATCRVSE